MTRFGFLLGVAALSAGAPAFAQSDVVLEVVPHRVAVLEGLDKVTARVFRIEAPIGDVIEFGTLDILVVACQERPPDQIPESAAYLEIYGPPTSRSARTDVAEALLFDGWMYASSPALSALEHPVYDVWVVDCKEPDQES